MKKRFSDEQVVGFLREAEAGVAVKDLCRTTVERDPRSTKWRPTSSGQTHDYRLAMRRPPVRL